MLRKINLICVGNLKKDYLKKLESRYINKINLITIDDSNLEIESKYILKILSGYRDKFCVLFDLNGKSDKNIYNEILNIFDSGVELFFIVGGSCGVSNGLVKMCDLSLKVSDFTYSHQIFRISAILIINKIFSKSL